MLRRDAANNNNSATTNIPQRLRDNVQAGCRQQLSSKAGRRQLIRADKAGCRQQLYFKAGGRQRSWCEYVSIFSNQQWNCHTVASLENSRLYIYTDTLKRVQAANMTKQRGKHSQQAGSRRHIQHDSLQNGVLYTVISFRIVRFCIAIFCFVNIMSGVGFRCFFKKNVWFFIFFAKQKKTCVSWISWRILRILKCNKI